MTVNAIWIQCLDKKDHLTSPDADILGAGHLQAECDTKVYPLTVSARNTLRPCRACAKTHRAGPASPPRGVPGEALRALARRLSGPIG